MKRMPWAAIVIALGLTLLVGYYTFCWQPEVPRKTLTFKVRVPHDDARIIIEGTTHAGKGPSREITAHIAEDSRSIPITAVWEPNNYTKIMRQRTVAVPAGGNITADLTRPDPQNPDAIEVIYVPTPQDAVQAMCKLAKVGPADVVYDLGCGDGRLVITAAKDFGAKRGVGVDLNPERVRESRAKAVDAHVADRVEFREGDILKIQDLSEATVVLLYIGDDIGQRLQPILQKSLKPGSRIVSHRFGLGSWKPDKTEKIFSAEWKRDIDLHLWTVK